ncbi:alpha/beta hydrolase [Streptomyces sp. B1866]|uniref:alpha/beta hydrolase n=1 Tax=Streptomyces sp. B1866 TaxID=3075431 RepID=UPI00288C8D51|nr:alpha/beta hydrolase [Streptomyces sp. B1866]MDT3398660.1 alpha/beta hydrolase [Streptomyces sp. B1866]
MREARLGRVWRARAADRTPRGVALLLPEGALRGSARPSALALAGPRPYARRLVRAARDEGLVAHVVHYRHRGWNGTAADLAVDAAWAVREVVRRYGDVPVCLVGQGMGGRAALRAAGHPAVCAVLALGPWLPERQAAFDPDPVRQLVGRQVLIVHGTNDTRAEPAHSYRFAERAKSVNPGVCRFEVHADGHRMRQYRDEVLALAADFLLGAVFGRDFSRPVADALAAPPPLGLRMPLAAGFGRTLGR